MDRGPGRLTPTRPGPPHLCRSPDDPRTLVVPRRSRDCRAGPAASRGRKAGRNLSGETAQISGTQVGWANGPVTCCMAPVHFPTRTGEPVSGPVREANQLR